VQKGKEDSHKKVKRHPSIGVVCARAEDLSDVQNVEEFIQSLRCSVKERGNVIMTRLNDVDLEKIDALVEVEVFKSRSEAVAYFIHEGIGARSDLFDRVTPTVEKIRQLKTQAREALGKTEKKELVRK
jgi:Arc/MetJ-type ribon-helix-helix transcriptional regulator